MFNNQNASLHYQSLFTSALRTILFLSIFLHAYSVGAETIPNFKSSYYVEAFGATLGKAHHSFNCKDNNCTLISRAKPSGFAALFIKDSSVEFIKLKQTNTLFKWLNYHKVGISEKDGKNAEKHITLALDEHNQEIIFLEKDRHWPIQVNIFDVMSLPYALQYYKLNNTPIKDLTLHIQDNNFQEQLVIKSFDQVEYVEFEFGFEEQKTLKYTLDSRNYQIELWLLANNRYFPGKIRLINKQEDKTITLKLAGLPKIL